MGGIMHSVMKQTRSGLRSAISLRVLLSSAALAVTACATTGGPSASPGNAFPLAAQDDPTAYDFVDCRLPGVVIQNGMNQTRQMRGRLVRVTARSCQVRGGRYVVEDRSSIEGSLQAWLPDANNGDAKAQTYVGELYERGPGGQPDYEMARIWYQRAADQGYTPAQFNLARFYEQGLGGPADPAKATSLYYQAMGVDASLQDTVSLVDPRELAILRADLAERDAIIARQQETIDGLNGEINSLRQQLEDARTNVSALETDLAASRSQLANGMARQADDRQVLAGQLAELERQRAALNDTASRLQMREAELTRQQASFASMVDAASSAANADLIAGLRAELETAQAQIARLSSEHARAASSESSALQALSEAEADYQSRLGGLSERERQLAEREAAIQAMTERYGEQSVIIASEREALERARTAIASDRIDLDRQRLAVETSLAELRNERAVLAAVEAELAGERTRLAAQSAELGRLSAGATELAAERADLERGRAELADAAEELDELRANYESRLEELYIREADLDAATAQLSTTRETVEGQETELAQLRRQLSEAEARAIDAETKLAVAEQDLAVIFTAMERYRSLDGQPIERTTPRPTDMDVDFGNYHAILIGNENYEDPLWPDLRTSHEDVERVAQILKDRYGFETTIVLKDARRIETNEEIIRIADELDENDNLLIYFAGHGQYSDVIERGSWEPVDSVPYQTYQSITVEWINDVMKTTRARKVLVIADSCYSGAFTRGPVTVLGADASEGDMERYYQTLAARQSRNAFSSGGLQPVADGGGGQNSLFANALIRTLMENDEIVTGQTLAERVSKLVIESELGAELEQEPQYRPIDRLNHDGGDFLFVPQL